VNFTDGFLGPAKMSAGKKATNWTRETLQEKDTGGRNDFGDDC